MLIELVEGFVEVGDADLVGQRWAVGGEGIFKGRGGRWNQAEQDDFGDVGGHFLVYWLFTELFEDGRRRKRHGGVSESQPL